MSISEKLKHCDSVASVNDFVNQLTCKIGIFGGRRFYLQDQAGSVCMDDLVKCIQKFYEVFQKTSKNDDIVKKFNELEEFFWGVKKIRDIDSNADKKLTESFILQRIFTALRRWLGNRGYDRQKVLDGITEAYNKCKEEKIKILEEEHNKRRQEIKISKEKFFQDIVTACGKEKFEALPVLDLKDNIGETGYIDFITPNHMTAPVMRFQDLFGRRGFAVRGRRSQDKEDGVQTFFERYSEEHSWTWAGYPLISMGSSGHFVSCGKVDEKIYSKVKALLKGLVDRDDQDKPLDNQTITDLVTEVEAG